MNIQKQVEKSHYEFNKYMTIERWCSIWHQLDEVIRLRPETILEIGPGPGIFKNVALLFGVSVETLDLDPELNPDHVGSATTLPFEKDQYDVLCAFQMLEHLNYEDSLKAFSEMVRVSKGFIVISLPDVRTSWRYLFDIPKLGRCDFSIQRPLFKARTHEFDGEHFWEISKRGYELDRIIRDFSKLGAHLVKTYRVKENAYHRFFVFRIKN